MKSKLSMKKKSRSKPKLIPRSQIQLNVATDPEIEVLAENKPSNKPKCMKIKIFKKNILKKKLTQEQIQNNIEIKKIIMKKNIAKKIIELNKLAKQKVTTSTAIPTSEDICSSRTTIYQHQKPMIRIVMKLSEW